MTDTTERVEFQVVAIDATEAATAAKDEARRQGMRVVTVATVRPYGDGRSWLVKLAVRVG